MLVSRGYEGMSYGIRCRGEVFGLKSFKEEYVLDAVTDWYS